MSLKAGAAQIDISPKESQFLYGYPYVERNSIGIHDPLWSSAIYLADGLTEVIFITNDIIFVPKTVVHAARDRIFEQTHVPQSNIMISATHTHSGPATMDSLVNEADSAVAPADPRYVKQLEDGIVWAAVKAYNTAQSAHIGFTIADSTGIGTNRRDPKGPSDHEIPVMLVRTTEGQKNIACMLVCCMHPTVLHEDSKLVSADFPGFARVYLQENLLGRDCIVLHHSGPCGNQSPRHVTQANTFEEADRIGTIVGKAIEKSLTNLEFIENLKLNVKQGFVDLPKKKFLEVDEAQKRRDNAVNRLAILRNQKASEKLIRTAECDWFGAERLLILAKAARTGHLDKIYESILPAEIQIIQIGHTKYVSWPGEIFVEYALKVKGEIENTFIISLANGNLNGYVTTEEAAQEGGYEASSGLISYEAGNILVEKTIELISKQQP